MTGLVFRGSAVAIGSRAVLIEGAPGSGKSSLALALIDRGAALIGDDAVLLAAGHGRLSASPAPNIAGLLEVRGVGLIDYPVQRAVPVGLIVRLDRDAPRHIQEAELRDHAGISVPLVALWPDSPVLAVRTEAALARWGLSFGNSEPQPLS